MRREIESAAHFLQEDRPDRTVEAMLGAFGRPIGGAVADAA